MIRPHYHVLVCDYDGTLATDGRVDEATTAALERVRASSRKLVMVTGRQVPDLVRVFPEIELFDLVVAENGGVLFRPLSGTERTLAGPPPPPFVAALARRRISPLSVGRVIVATREPHAGAVREVTRELGLDLQVILNKGAVMVLPAGVDKATGMQTALEELALSGHDAVGVGDAENDLAFLSRCGCAVAVSNALAHVKKRADLVTDGARGAGVVELIDRLLGSEPTERLSP